MRTAPGTGCGEAWVRAAPGGSWTRGPGGRCWGGTCRVGGPRAELRPGMPPDGPQFRWSPEQPRLCMCTGEADWTSAWPPGAGGRSLCDWDCCGEMSRGAEERWWG